MGWRAFATSGRFMVTINRRPSVSTLLYWPMALSSLRRVGSRGIVDAIVLRPPRRSRNRRQASPARRHCLSIGSSRLMLANAERHRRKGAFLTDGAARARSSTPQALHRVGDGAACGLGGLANRPTAMARATYWAMQL